MVKGKRRGDAAGAPAPRPEEASSSPPPTAPSTTSFNFAAPAAKVDGAPATTPFTFPTPVISQPTFSFAPIAGLSEKPKEIVPPGSASPKKDVASPGKIKENDKGKEKETAEDKKEKETQTATSPEK